MRNIPKLFLTSGIIIALSFSVILLSSWKSPQLKKGKSEDTTKTSADKKKSSKYSRTTIITFDEKGEPHEKIIEDFEGDDGFSSILILTAVIGLAANLHDLGPVDQRLGELAERDLAFRDDDATGQPGASGVRGVRFVRGGGETRLDFRFSVHHLRFDVEHVAHVRRHASGRSQSDGLSPATLGSSAVFVRHQLATMPLSQPLSLFGRSPGTLPPARLAPAA